MKKVNEDYSEKWTPSMHDRFQLQVSGTDEKRSLNQNKKAMIDLMQFTLAQSKY